MSESDDTDVLLLIPPDLFIVPSSESDDERPRKTKPGVVSELIGHLQSLETRVSAIESKDNSLDTSLNNSLDLAKRTSYPSPINRRQALPKTKFTVSQNSSLQNSPEKPRPSSSVPSTPKASLKSKNTHTNDSLFNLNISNHITSNNHSLSANTHPRKKHGDLTSFLEPSIKCSSSQNTGFLHAIRSPKKGTCLLSHKINTIENVSHAKPYEQSSKSLPTRLNSSCQLVGQLCAKSKQVKDMNLSQVDELLQEMEATELELAKRISCTDSKNGLQHTSNHIQNNFMQGISGRHSTPHKRLDFEKEEKELSFYDSLLQYTPSKQDQFCDFSLPFDDTLQFIETEKMLADYKAWDQSAFSEIADWKGNFDTKESSKILIAPESKEIAGNSKMSELGQKMSTVNTENQGDAESLHTKSLPTLNMDLAIEQVNDSEKSCALVQSKEPDIKLSSEKLKNFQSLGNLQNVKNEGVNINSTPFKVPDAPASGFDVLGKPLFNVTQNQKDDIRPMSRLKSTNHAATNTEPSQRFVKVILIKLDY